MRALIILFICNSFLFAATDVECRKEAVARNRQIRALIYGSTAHESWPGVGNGDRDQYFANMNNRLPVNTTRANLVQVFFMGHTKEGLGSNARKLFLQDQGTAVTREDLIEMIAIDGIEPEKLTPAQVLIRRKAWWLRRGHSLDETKILLTSAPDVDESKIGPLNLDSHWQGISSYLAETRGWAKEELPVGATRNELIEIVFKTRKAKKMARESGLSYEEILCWHTLAKHMDEMRGNLMLNISYFILKNRLNGMSRQKAESLGHILKDIIDGKREGSVAKEDLIDILFHNAPPKERKTMLRIKNSIRIRVADLLRWIAIDNVDPKSLSAEQLIERRKVWYIKRGFAVEEATELVTEHGNTSDGALEALTLGNHVDQAQYERALKNARAKLEKDLPPGAGRNELIELIFSDGYSKPSSRNIKVQARLSDLTYEEILRLYVLYEQKNQITNRILNNAYTLLCERFEEGLRKKHAAEKSANLEGTREGKILSLLPMLTRKEAEQFLNLQEHSDGNLYSLKPADRNTYRKLREKKGEKIFKFRP